MILYEDEQVLVLSKPFGSRCKAARNEAPHRRHTGRHGGPLRRSATPLHRLDRDTTGVLLVAKHRDAAAKLGRVFQTRAVAKTYWALVKGVPKPDQGKIQAPLVKAAGPDGDGCARRCRVSRRRPCMRPPTIGGRPRGQQSGLGVAEACHRAPAQAPRHMALIGNPIVGTTTTAATRHGSRSKSRTSCTARAPARAEAPITSGKIDVTARLPDT